ncbi:hypothetical protein SAMN05216215_1018117 [Saccharopolyspora shandongensis]|uniref:Uncharacterized protein n=1 Tax=Saccharopolyspora shandongensis TaxID=418495 RepID=A0A1H3GCB5_9PSEU|nr:hypothetical protein [Saccharopolyspora shandongensis]SDY00695.1 hypothetical protein SAMN05216215_1018117 [Saccharopolyspora shandongensis]
MAGTDIFDHIAALAYPMPTDPAQCDPPDLIADAQDHVRELREDYAHNLRGAWEAEDWDPLLTEIERVRRQRDEVDRQLRQLIAYGREFVGPRPYPLATLAKAAGLGSHSSARTFYGEDEVAAVAAVTGAKRTSHSRS